MQTLGEKRCNYHLNEEPLEIRETRKTFANIIDQLEAKRGDRNTAPVSGETQRLVSLAQTKLEEACMFSVKALYQAK